MAEIIRLFPEPSRLKRPAPPVAMLDRENFETPTFVPAAELESWMRSTFIEEGASLQNDDHFHLRLRTSVCSGCLSRIRGMAAVSSVKPSARTRATSPA
jgi:hypothetical protein